MRKDKKAELASEDAGITVRISQLDESEFVGEIINIFENFLDKRNINIENKERDEDSKETDDLAVIYGSDYDEIGDQIREVLKRWSK